MTCPASKRTTRPRATRTSVAAAGSPPKTSLHARARRSRAPSPSRLPADGRRTSDPLASVILPQVAPAPPRPAGIVGAPPDVARPGRPAVVHGCMGDSLAPIASLLMERPQSWERRERPAVRLVTPPAPACHKGPYYYRVRSSTPYQATCGEAAERGR